MPRMTCSLLFVALVACLALAQDSPESTNVATPDALPPWIEPDATPRQQAAQDILHTARLRRPNNLRSAILLLLEVLEMPGNDLANERFAAISQFNEIDEEGREDIIEANINIKDEEPEEALRLLDNVARNYIGCQCAMRADAYLNELCSDEQGTQMLWDLIARELEEGHYYRAREHLRLLRSQIPRESERYSKIVSMMSDIRVNHQRALDAQVAETMILEGRGLYQRERFEDAYQRFDYVTSFQPGHPEVAELEKRKADCVAKLAERGRRYEFRLHNNNIIDGVVLWRRNAQIAVQVANGVVFLDVSDVAEEKSKD